MASASVFAVWVLGSAGGMLEQADDCFHRSSDEQARTF
jgi:hypothetical protein